MMSSLASITYPFHIFIELKTGSLEVYVQTAHLTLGQSAKTVARMTERDFVTVEGAGECEIVFFENK
jgi:hypothetical protein